MDAEGCENEHNNANVTVTSGDFRRDNEFLTSIGSGNELRVCVVYSRRTWNFGGGGTSMTESFKFYNGTVAPLLTVNGLQTN